MSTSKKAAFAFGIGASLLMAAGTASAASNCGTEVQSLQQQLGMEQGANSKTGPNDTGVQQPSPSASVDSGTSAGTATDLSGNTTADSSGANSKAGPNDTGVQQPQPEANATGSTGSGSTTTSTADKGSGVATNNENSGGSGSSAMPSGTVTESSRSGTLNVEPNARSSALASLEKAKTYADSGDEEACMSQLNSARQQLGVQ